ncbi:hypothetical protein ACOMHN_062467 [Nucella lapillus]
MSRRRTNVRQYSAEDQALTDISKEAENRLAAKRAARTEAREIRMKEIDRQQKEADEKERLGSDIGTTRSRPQSVAGSAGSRRGSFDSSEGTNSVSGKDRDLKNELRTLEEKYKGAMMTSAQLDNERQSLVYQVELFKDQLEELTEGHTELQREYKDKNRDLEMTKRELKAAQLEVKGLRDQNDYKDRLITESGLVIVAAENGDLALEQSKEAPSANGPVGTGGLLLSSEALVLLNKGREGSLGMHSLASSHSDTHTTQSASSTPLSQPPRDTPVEEPQSQNHENVSQTESVESSTTKQDSEGSSVDGPQFLKSDGETCVGSSSGVSGDAEAGVCAEAVDALSEQPGAAAVSHSPEESEKSLHQADGNALDAGSTSLCGGEGIAEQGSEAAVGSSPEVTGNESAEESTSEGMLTPLHGSDDVCKDKGWKESDGAEGVGHQSGGGDQTDSSVDGSVTESVSESSPSALPSVVVTECSHSEDEEGDEFFDAVSTPLPSSTDTDFDFVEIEAGTEGNVAGSVQSENGEDVAGEDGKEIMGEGGEQSDGEDGKEREEEGGNEAVGKDGKQTDEELKEVDGEGGEGAVEEDGKQTDKESSKEVHGEDSKEADEDFKETDGEGIVDEADEIVDGEASKEAGKEEHEEPSKDSEKAAVVEDGTATSGEDKQPAEESEETSMENPEEEIQADCKEIVKEATEVTSEVQIVKTDVEETGRDIAGTDHKRDKQEIEGKDTESDSETPGAKSDQADADKSTEIAENEKPAESSGGDVCDESDTSFLENREAGVSALVRNDVDASGQKGKGDGVNEEGNVEQSSVRVDDDVKTDVCEVGDAGAEGDENALQQSQMPGMELGTDSEETVGALQESLDVHSHPDGAGVCKEEADEKEEAVKSDNKDQTLSSDEPSSNETEDTQKSPHGEIDLNESGGGSATVSEEGKDQTTSSPEGETDHSGPPDPTDEKLNLEDSEDTVMKSTETSSDQSHSAPASGDDSRKDAEGTVEEESVPESKEGEVDKEDKNKESEELPDTLSPISPRKPLNQGLSEGGTSEDSEAQVNDDEYDFDDIDAVLDNDSPAAGKGKDDEPNVDAESDDKVSFGSKDSGLQESFANKEDTVSFGSRDSGLQESVSIKEKDSVTGDNVSMQSRDSGAGIEDIPSTQNQDSSSKPAAEAEEGAVGGSLESKRMLGSRESLDLEAKLDKMVSEGSATKETPGKEKHRHKMSQKFKMFKNIFK